ncbi:MAG: hypothetical protein ACOH13_13870 [Flavobacteriales bacterium]
MQLRLSYFTLSALLLSGTLHAQEDTSEIGTIRRIVQEINTAKDYEVKTLDIEDLSDEMTDGGGELTAWMRNGRVVKMVEWLGLSSCVDITEYYLQDSQLVFVYEQGSESPYVDSIGSFDRTILDRTMEARFYFHDGKLIKSDLRGFTRCGGAPSKEWAVKCQREALRLKDLFTRKQ